ncbi:rod shape-determining protein MreC [Patescibacteria group bacterium]|nr:rod shape-determining protein MreC [Patescibacteria group bacterium]
MKLSFKKNKILIIVVVVILLVFLLNVFQKEVRSLFYSFSAPIQKVLWGAGDSTSDFFQGIVRVKTLKQESDELKLENQELLSQVVALKNLKKENETLRQALDLGLQEDFKLALAQLIGKDISQDFILIDKGAKDAVTEDMPVITQQRVLIGRISEVYEGFSKVMLISHKESSFDAKVDNISGVIRGQGNFRILFDLILREENLSQGDIVVTSVLGRIFPEGLLVGRIKQIKRSDVEPFQQAEIEPFFDISQIETLFIILDF